MFVDKEIRQVTDALGAAIGTEDRHDPVAEAFAEGAPRVVPRGGRVVTLGTSLFADVDVYPELFRVLDMTSTQGGSACLRAILDSPVADTGVLRTRQQVLKNLSHVLTHPAHHDLIRQSLSVLKQTELDVAWVLHHPKHDEELRELYDMAFFKMWPLRWMNRSPAALTALNVHRIVVSPLIGLLSPLIYFVIPYLVLRLRVGLKVSFVQYLRIMLATMHAASVDTPASVKWAKCASLGFSLLFYFQGLFSSIEMSGTISSVCSALCRRAKKVEGIRCKAAVSSRGGATPTRVVT
ncbi:MAG: hypothetical protein WDW38_006590 [Sanguina aurantia]